MLDFPYISIIPYSVMSCGSLEPSAKLYYGCLAGLARQEGYCWATDSQLAEMHKVCERQIKRWNESLEKNGFIKRQTENKTYRNDDGKLLWKKTRKIYVSEGFSKNVSEGDKNVPIDEGDKNVPIDEGDKNVPYNKTISNNKSITTTRDRKKSIASHCKNKPTKKPKPAAAAVVFSCLNGKDITQKEKEWISRTYSEEIVKHAVAFTEAPQTKIATSYVQTLKWACKVRPELPSAFDKDSNKNISQSKIRPLEKIDENWEINVTSEHVEFLPIYRNGAGIQKGNGLYFSYEKKSFWNDLKEFVKSKIPKLYEEISI
jgi:hypothetical protein